MLFEDIVKKMRPEFFEKKCYTCIHRRTIAGDAHSSCATKTALVMTDPHGVKNGWCSVPFNFDPTWIIACDSHQMKDKVFKGDPKEEAEFLLGYTIQKMNLLKESGEVNAMETAIIVGTKINEALSSMNVKNKGNPSDEEWSVLRTALYKI